MLIIGLTGSMGTGKSTLIDRIHQNLPWPIWDADREVKKLYDDHCVIQKISKALPGAFDGQGSLDRTKLRDIVSQDHTAVCLLENILHPILTQYRHEFIESMERRSQKVIVLDIPLLFEKGIEKICDLTVVTSCPFWLQEQRILSRPGMTRELMHILLSRHYTSEEKRRRADIIVETGLSKRHSWCMFIKSLEYKNVIA